MFFTVPLSEPDPHHRCKEMLQVVSFDPVRRSGAGSVLQASRYRCHTRNCLLALPREALGVHVPLMIRHVHDESNIFLCHMDLRVTVVDDNKRAARLPQKITMASDLHFSLFLILFLVLSLLILISLLISHLSLSLFSLLSLLSLSLFISLFLSLLSTLSFFLSCQLSLSLLNGNDNDHLFSRLSLPLCRHSSDFP